MIKGQRPIANRLAESATVRVMMLVGSIVVFLKTILALAGEGGDDEGGGDGGEGSGSEGDGDGDGSESGQQSSSGTEQTGSQEEKPPKGKEETVSKEEFDALKARMVQADRRASEAEKKVKDYERKEQTELEQAQNDLSEKTSKLEEVGGENLQLKAEVAFLKNSKHQFSNNNAALRLARDYFEDFSDDDGNVDMDKVVDKVATDYPELLLKKGEGEGGDGGPSGAPLRGGSGGGTGRTDKKLLRKKYSALRR